MKIEKYANIYLLTHKFFTFNIKALPNKIKQQKIKCPNFLFSLTCVFVFEPNSMK